MPYDLLKRADTPAELRKLDPADLPELAAQLRRFIIEAVAAKEGHLGASLGVVELTIALHYVFDTPDDILIWDVGHQAYGHKILTGRRENFGTNRQLGGIAGFPKIDESPYDAFGTGHSSTAISAALGMAIASKLQGNPSRSHIAVVGDASIASGMAFEGLNHAGVTDANLLVILNDNAIGIDPSVGALKEYLTSVREGRDTRRNNLIKSLNFDYTGPIDGHDLPGLVSELSRLREMSGPRFLHITTTKGKGLQQAEADQVKYHAPGRFDPQTGDLIPTDETGMPPKFQDVFGLTLVELAQMNQNIIGITPAMPSGSSLKFMMDRFPNRAFDVGIAEQHAVTFAAGLAARGKVVFCNIYSTFLQRAYDQVIHDVALQNLPVIFCLDRAGIVGEDGPTHHGVFDIAFLRCVPNLTIFAPRDEPALRNIMYTAQLGMTGPIAIRYPRGRGFIVNWQTPFEKIEIGKAQLIKTGRRVAILSCGTIGDNVSKAIEWTGNPDDFAHFDFGFVKPLDTAALLDIFNTHEIVVTVEDGCLAGGFGSAVLEYAAAQNAKVPIKCMGIPDTFVPHGTVSQLQQISGLDPKSIAQNLSLL